MSLPRNRCYRLCRLCGYAVGLRDCGLRCCAGAHCRGLFIYGLLGFFRLFIGVRPPNQSAEDNRAEDEDYTYDKRGVGAALWRFPLFTVCLAGLPRVARLAFHIWWDLFRQVIKKAGCIKSYEMTHPNKYSMKAVKIRLCSWRVFLSRIFRAGAQSCGVSCRQGHIRASNPTRCGRSCRPGCWARSRRWPDAGDRVHTPS